MRVNIEAQYLCIKQELIRGVPFYIKNLLDNLAVFGTNDYSLSVFDHLKERNNIDYINQYLKKDTLARINAHECNDLSYKDFSAGYLDNTKKTYDSKSYEDYFGSKFDIVHFPTVLVVPQNVSSKTVVTVHDLIPCLPDFQANWSSDVQKVFLRSVDYVRDKKDITIIADSVSTRNDIISYTGIDDSRIFVIPLAIDNENVYHQENKDILKKMCIDSEFILYLGALDPRKGIINMIESFTSVKDKYPDIKLVLAGGMETNYRDKIEEALSLSKYRKDIILTGYVTEEEKRVLLSSSEMFLFPSEYEGFGLPVLEAMTCGTPVITSSVSSLPEVGGEAALYVTPNDPEDLADKILLLLDDTGLRKELREKSLLRSREFSWQKTVKMTEEVYQYALSI